MYIENFLNGDKFPVDFNKIERIEISDGVLKTFRKGLQVGTYSLKIFEDHVKFVITEDAYNAV